MYRINIINAPEVKLSTYNRYSCCIYMQFHLPIHEFTLLWICAQLLLFRCIGKILFYLPENTKIILFFRIATNMHWKILTTFSKILPCHKWIPTPDNKPLWWTYSYFSPATVYNWESVACGIQATRKVYRYLAGIIAIS